MSDYNIIRFRAGHNLLSDLSARADGASLHETAHRDLREFYHRLAIEQWPQVREHMLKAFRELHAVGFDAVQLTGTQATISLRDDNGSPREVPVYGHNGLGHSIRIMIERGLLEEGDQHVYDNLLAAYNEAVAFPDHVEPLGEVRTFLVETQHLKQKMANTVPPTLRA